MENINNNEKIMTTAHEVREKATQYEPYLVIPFYDEEESRVYFVLHYNDGGKITEKLLGSYTGPAPENPELDSEWLNITVK